MFPYQYASQTQACCEACEPYDLLCKLTLREGSRNPKGSGHTWALYAGRDYVVKRGSICREGRSAYRQRGSVCRQGLCMQAEGLCMQAAAIQARGVGREEEGFFCTSAERFAV